MKILKKLFLIGLFSFVFFINNVKAVAQYNFTNNFYNTAVDNYLTYNSGKTFDDFVELLNPFIDDLQSEIGSNNYIIYFDNYPSSSYPQYFRLYYVYGDFHLSTYLSSSKGGLRFYKDTSLKWNYKDFRFNSNYTQLSLSSSSTTTDNSFLGFASDNTIWSVVLYSNIDSIKYTQYSWSDFSFSINNIGEYILPSDVPLSSFMNTKYNFEIYDYFNPTEPLNCSKSQVLGFLSNVSDFTFRIKGESNALSEPIRGQLQFNYPSDITVTNSDLTIDIVQFNDNEVAGNYKLNCPDNIKACYIEYSYNYIDDITSEVDFGIKVTFNTNNSPRYIQLYNCFHNDMYDYYNSSYTYTNSPGSSSNNDSVLTNFLQDGSLDDGASSDFFNNFKLEDNGGISEIITLPLQALRAMGNGQCSNLSATIKGKQLIMPCGYEFWNKIPNDFKTFYKIVFQGIISFYLLKDLYYTSERMKNTDDDRVEVLDL